MAEKILVNVENIAVFECPRCAATRTVDMSDKNHLGDTIKTRCTCKKCDNVFIVDVVMERRKYYRKETNLAGEFSSHDKSLKGLMKVHNVSLSGIRFKVNEPKELKEGQRLSVIFTLDDSHRSEIKKEVMVKKADGLFINAEFVAIDQYDRLASYLFG